MDVKSLDAAHRPDPWLDSQSIERHDHDRPMILLGQPARDDANHSGMPISPGQHQRGVALQIEFLLGLLMRGEIDAPFQAVAAVVQLVQIVGQSRRSIGRCGRQQFDRQLGLSQSAGGIQSRGKHEADVFALQTRLFGELGQLQQPLHSQTGPAAKTRQAMMNQNSIFIHQRHDIGHGSDRRESDRLQKELAHRRADFLGVARPLTKCPSHFERHARTTESAEWIRRARQSRMHDRRGRGQPLAPFVMIGDDEL